MPFKSETGVVVIGRNEGVRLENCLDSIISSTRKIVYVDSGSTDQSVENATAKNIEVVSLDMSIGFTAARARNAGATRLKQCYPEVNYIQFVDGDCEMAIGWFDTAASVLDDDKDIGIVCGRRREKYPDNSVYNSLCDLEWDTPIGYVDYCGGDFMIRAYIFEQIGGFNPTLIAGEEPELCLRLRKAEFKILRISHEMSMHDANISRFSQWWRRTVRGGHAFLEVSLMHFSKNNLAWITQSIRIWAWGFFIPISIITSSLINHHFLFLLAIYPIQVYRIALKRDLRNTKSWLYGLFMTLGKFPELQGQIIFLAKKMIRSNSALIEYK